MHTLLKYLEVTMFLTCASFASVRWINDYFKDIFLNPRSGDFGYIFSFSFYTAIVIMAVTYAVRIVCKRYREIYLLTEVKEVLAKKQ